MSRKHPELLAAAVMALASNVTPEGHLIRGRNNRKRTPTQRQKARRRAIAKASRKRNRG